MCNVIIVNSKTETKLTVLVLINYNQTDLLKLKLNRQDCLKDDTVWKVLMCLGERETRLWCLLSFRDTPFNRVING